jgi:HSP20 family molecular chaperone IbpA
MADEKKDRKEKDLEHLKEEIAQKGKEIEQLKKTVEEMRTQIHGKEKSGEAIELEKIFSDVSELLNVGFGIFGTSEKPLGEKSASKGLVGLINDLAELAEKSETYQKRIKLGDKGVIDFHVSTRPLKKSNTTKQNDSFKISKPKKEISPTRTQMLPATGSIKEREPIVDVFEEGDHITVMAELPGVNEDEIKLEIENDILVINTGTSTRKYCKKIELPSPVEKDAVESSYKNGILKVKLRKAKKDS